jgi:hypothetical protein
VYCTKGQFTIVNVCVLFLGDFLVASFDNMQDLLEKAEEVNSTKAYITNAETSR